MYATYITENIMTFSSSGMCRDIVSIIQAWHRLKQCVLNAETNDGSTVQYSPISKDGLLPSLRGPTSLQLQQLVVSAPVQIFARLHALGKGKSRSNSTSHILFSSSCSRVRAPWQYSRWKAEAIREQRTLHASDRISRAKIPG
jgi:hypothetical protein